MNALAAFTSWGCEDRLSGPAFADLSAVIGWLRERDAWLAAGAQLSCGAAAGGIHAVADIPRGAVVASIPLSLLITQATAHAEAELRGVRGGTNLVECTTPTGPSRQQEETNGHDPCDRVSK